MPFHGRQAEDQVGVSAVAVTGRGAPSSSPRSFAAASVIAHDHEAVPLDPLAAHAGPKSLSAILMRIVSAPTPSASAATAVKAVRAPVPMSQAPIVTVKVPSASAVIEADDGTAPVL
jgi:hypothetical protein